MNNIKKHIVIILSSVFVFAGSVGCGQERLAAEPARNAVNVANGPKDTKMKMMIGSKVFDAVLFDNPTAAALKAMLPLTLEMDELNGNEKKYDLQTSLPTDASDPKNINTGDLMLWGNNTLVLFYKTFPTRYSYTKIGRIDDPVGLEAVVGSGDVTVTFELEE